MIHRLTACVVGLAFLGLAVQPVSAQDGAKEITNSLGMKLVPIPAGKFLMGSPPSEAERDPEELQHEVEISRSFYLAVHEVTQEQFERLVERVKGNSLSFFHDKNGGGPDHPVDQVQWPQAMQFCQKLSALRAEKNAGRVYRLPTEAEWEYACRAGTTTPSYFGNALSSAEANCNGKYPYGGAAKGAFLNRTAKVGSYKPNAWGLYDMHGNVWEWCADWYDPDYYKGSPKVDPKGPDKGIVPTGFRDQYFRVVRGGCWLDEARGCRSAYRFRLMPDERYRWAGFRVVCETPESKSAERIKDLKKRISDAEAYVQRWSGVAAESQRLMALGRMSPTEFTRYTLRLLDAQDALQRLRDELRELSKKDGR